jgi:hypothetical protein
MAHAQSCQTAGVWKVGKHPYKTNVPITNWVYVADCLHGQYDEAIDGFATGPLWIVACIDASAKRARIAVREEDVLDAQVILRRNLKRHPGLMHILPGSGMRATITMTITDKNSDSRDDGWRAHQSTDGWG